MPQPRVPRTAAGLDARWTAEPGPNRLVYGPGAVAELGPAAGELGARHALLVTDAGIVAAGHAERAAAILLASGIAVRTWSDVAADPTSADVDRAAQFARAGPVDLIVALGGGSPLDVAKGVNFVLTNGGRMEDYWGNGKATQPMLPAIAIPTTAGTGSEAQSFALISHDESHRKMACGDHKARFRIAILDPELTASLPRAVAAVAGLDAIAHAVESFVSRAATPVSKMFAREAWRLLDASFVAALGPAPAVAARGGMLLGAYLAGCAIEGSMLGAAHACANPLTEQHGVTHGVAVSLMLPHVVRFNDREVGDAYRQLVAGGGKTLPARLTELRELGGLPARIRDLGLGTVDLDRLAADAATQWTAGFNPRPVEVSDLRDLYKEAY